MEAYRGTSESLGWVLRSCVERSPDAEESAGAEESPGAEA